AVAVTPRPEYRPFLELAAADAQVREDLSTVMSLRRKRRGSVQHLQNPPDRPVRVPVPDLRPATSSPPRWPARPRPNDPASRLYRARARRLTPQQEAAIRALAVTKSLRSLAAEFGVSHETIRAVVRATS
ncbi:MAG: hypothetical protein M3Q71_01610, partial [Chloroflexota bacterium]|nr:hypothetical protein [Chloroflexota bacterium]